MVSTRAQKAQGTSNAIAHIPAKLSAGHGSGNMQPPAKRARMKRSEAGGAESPSARDATTESGLRERLLSLPVEIFGEICSFLDAIELRHLALTDKTFWSVLAAPKSDPFWRHAFKQTVPPLPECPEPMSKPDYARFMLAQSCMVGKSWPTYLNYFHRLRYCNKCFEDNMLSKEEVLELHPDFPPEFLKYLSSNSDGTTLATAHYRWGKNQRQYLKLDVVAVYKLWKSLSESAENPEPANTQLTSRLEKYADDRIRSGLKMNHWQIAAYQLKEAQLTKLRNERSAMVFAKLSELGYQTRDYPRWHHEVRKPKTLTDEEWERIRHIIITATESNKANRIANEQRIRKNLRTRDLTTLWSDVVAVASGTRAVNISERAACPLLNEFLDFAPVAALMEADTNGISEQDLSSLRSDALLFVIQERRRYLVRLHNIRNGLPIDQVDEEEWDSLSNDEIIAKLDTIAADLVQAVNGFWDSKRKTVEWYPAACLKAASLDPDVLSAAEHLAPGLISKMLEIIGKDPNTEAGAAINGHWGLKPVLYRCGRCDERLAPTLAFKDLISHYLENKVWFDKASDAREKAVIESAGSKEPRSFSTLFDSHDWNTDGEIIASDSLRDKARVTKLQKQLESAYGNEPEDYEGQDFTTRSRRSTNKAPERRTRRICRLCPEGFSPKPIYFAALKVHIEHVHCKVANVEEDTVAFDPSRDIAPVNPWILDVPSVAL
ncbi:hypothetical protein FRC01_005394 [Tulasnella sp. 417]|nr:hypothetical protein FRC01_005394 [Tulasnella sp. 417]